MAAVLCTWKSCRHRGGRASRRRTLRLFLCAVLLSGAGCSPAGPGGGARHALRIGVAASLGRAADELAARWATAEGRQPILVTGSSSSLRVQIEYGAPLDLFLAADLEQPAALAAAGLAEEPIVFTRNELVFAYPAAASPPEQFHGLPEGRLGGTDEAVPLGRYTAEALKCLAGAPGMPGDIEHEYRRRLVTREADAGALRSRLELGQLAGAFLYRSDVYHNPALGFSRLPQRCRRSLPYGACILRRSTRNAEARRFLQFILSAEGQAILASNGFLPAAGADVRRPQGAR